MSKDLRVLVKRVGREPTIEFIKDTLKAKQELVGGLIEVVSYNDEILLICNEEGKLFNLPPNLAFDYDYIAGDCFFVGDDYDKGDYKDLTDKQVEDLREMIREREIHYISTDSEKSLDDKER